MTAPTHLGDHVEPGTVDARQVGIDVLRTTLEHAQAEIDAIQVDEPQQHLRYRNLAQTLKAASQLANGLADRSKPPKRPPRTRVRSTTQGRSSAPMDPSLGPLIAEARERAGLDVRAAAVSCDMQAGGYRLVEDGTKTMRLDTAQRIAEVPWLPAELGERLVESIRVQLGGPWRRDRAS